LSRQSAPAVSAVEFLAHALPAHGSDAAAASSPSRMRPRP
jgi:hypothetical protein